MKYDVLIIGAGPGGVECARILARNGKKVGIIEEREVGGICLNRGCIPAKTMLYSAEMFRIGKKIRNYGILFCQDTPGFDFDGMVAKRAEVMDKLRKGLTFLLKKDGADLIEGRGELISQNKVLVNGTEYEADQIVIATGGYARKFPGFKDNDERYLVSDHIFGLKAFPQSILIVGGGPVGTEFATFFRTFDIDVHIVDKAPYFVRFFDGELGTELAKSFKRDGMNVYLNTGLESIDDTGEKLKVKLDDGTEFEVEKVLSAIGMIPFTDHLKMDGIEINPAGRIVVNEHLQTTVPNVYALGDANGLSGSAYGAEREGLHIAYHILGKDLEDVPVNYVAFPDVVFSEPQIGTCGYSEEELKEKGIEYDVAKVQFMVNGKAVIKGDTRGFCKILAEKGTGKVLGVHIIGPDATEIIHQASGPIHAGMTVKQWLHTVWGHPVLAEIVKEALLGFE